MQETLVRQEGIKAATVTFSVPESSSYIWDESNQQKSTGNVTVQMKPGYELTPERVSAIKHLASTSIPKLDPEDVCGHRCCHWRGDARCGRCRQRGLLQRPPAGI